MTDERQSTLQQGVAHLKSVDPVLSAIIANAPLPTITPHRNYYQELVESIISQQLSVRAAATILRRFKELSSNEFPTPAEIIATEIEQFRAVGLSRQKATYIRDLAQRVLDGSVQFDHLDSLSNQAVIDELTQIKGVGTWTAHMFLLFCMGRLDVLPTGDLGIRNGIKMAYGLSEQPSEDDIRALAERNHWSPYESIASWYIWHSLDNKPVV